MHGGVFEGHADPHVSLGPLILLPMHLQAPQTAVPRRARVLMHMFGACARTRANMCSECGRTWRKHADLNRNFSLERLVEELQDRAEAKEKRRLQPASARPWLLLSLLLVVLICTLTLCYTLLATRAAAPGADTVDFHGPPRPPPPSATEAMRVEANAKHSAAASRRAEAEARAGEAAQARSEAQDKARAALEQQARVRARRPVSVHLRVRTG